MCHDAKVSLYKYSAGLFKETLSVLNNFIHDLVVITSNYETDTWNKNKKNKDFWTKHKTTLMCKWQWISVKIQVLHMTQKYSKSVISEKQCKIYVKINRTDHNRFEINGFILY